MKKPVFILLALTALDQAIKLLISKFVPNASLVLIPGVLRFEPTHNTHLNWIASMLGYKTPVWQMIALQILVLAVVTLLYRYLVYKSGNRQPLLVAFYSFVAAGICCSFIDVVFWGGSLDFMGLFNWFVFDTKDVYLNTASACFLVWLLKNENTNKGNLENKNNKLAVIQWMKAGFPMQPAKDRD